ncbi:YkvA family protein [Chamaesiphon sp. OTE_20_metabat_361]|uniref:YkvA family protein n=1 Tax=Chamaesiphon sp. OTE_20_metabat_361 TaxID=2964689 RepID=UPI00286AFEBF|nr:YkvA family protein [Chamaesiphon sp. OTE_20_metabat_361]
MNFNIHSLHNWYRSLLQNPKYRWWVVAASVVYLVSPIDLVPDFLPFAGLVDDTLIISLLVAEVSQIAKAKLQSKSNRVTVNKTDVSVQVVDVQPIQ